MSSSSLVRLPLVLGLAASTGAGVANIACLSGLSAVGGGFCAVGGTMRVDGALPLASAPPHVENTASGVEIDTEMTSDLMHL